MALKSSLSGGPGYSCWPQTHRVTFASSPASPSGSSFASTSSSALSGWERWLPRGWSPGSSLERGCGVVEFRSPVIAGYDIGAQMSFFQSSNFGAWAVGVVLCFPTVKPGDHCRGASSLAPSPPPPTPILFASDVSGMSLLMMSFSGLPFAWSSSEECCGGVYHVRSGIVGGATICHICDKERLSGGQGKSLWWAKASCWNVAVRRRLHGWPELQAVRHQIRSHTGLFTRAQPTSNPRRTRTSARPRPRSRNFSI